MKVKEFILEATNPKTIKPRNFVAKNAPKAGAGAHKDKKRAEKQGDVKHKNKFNYKQDDWSQDFERRVMKGVAEGSTGLSIQQLATISDEALDKAYGYGRSTPGNTFGWQANMMSASYAKKMIDSGVTDIEAISDAIHKGWNVTAQKFVANPDQFSDTEKLRAAGKLDAKLQQRAQLMKQNYAQLPEEEKEKDRVVARALLKALGGSQDVVKDSLEEMNRRGFLKGLGAAALAGAGGYYAGARNQQGSDKEGSSNQTSNQQPRVTPGTVHKINGKTVSKAEWDKQFGRTRMDIPNRGTQPHERSPAQIAASQKRVDAMSPEMRKRLKLWADGQPVDEGWKQNLAALGVAGALGLGSVGGAQASTDPASDKIVATLVIDGEQRTLDLTVKNDVRSAEQFVRDVMKRQGIENYQYIIKGKGQTARCVGGPCGLEFGKTREGVAESKNKTKVKEALSDTSLQALQKAKQEIEKNREADVSDWEKDFKQNFASKFVQDRPATAPRPFKKKEISRPSKSSEKMGPPKHLRSRTSSEMSALGQRIFRVADKVKALEKLKEKAEKMGLFNDPGLKADVDIELYMQNPEEDDYEALDQKLDTAIELLKNRIELKRRLYSSKRSSLRNSIDNKGSVVEQSVIKLFRQNISESFQDKKSLEQRLYKYEAAVNRAREATRVIKNADMHMEIIGEILELAKKTGIEETEFKYQIEEVYDAVSNLQSEVYKLEEPFTDAVRVVQNALDELENEEWERNRSKDNED